jgi:hypothetical protein
MINDQFKLQMSFYLIDKINYSSNNLFKHDLSIEFFE